VTALRLLVLLALSVFAAACGEDDASTGQPAADAERPVVVATTTQAADLARNTVGDRAEVIGLLAPNSDPHGYELRPRDVEALADAAVVIRSGGDLDAWVDEAVESSGTEAEVVNLIDSVETIAGEHGHEEEEVDPHWWQDPRNALRAVGAIEDAMAGADPDDAATYAANAQRYRRAIAALDQAIASCWADVPAAQRKLVTAHDALGYYARRYGLEVVGTVIPSLSTQGQASAGEVAELADTIRREKVAVIFAESSVSSKVEQAIARETGADVGRPLWADTLGPEGSDGATYLAALASNTEAMVSGLTGRDCRVAPTG
jgi:ABC-type Zn uptake system ZnuABC Zn-binding protein ZnuA